MIEQQPVTIERLERALALCAYLIELDGPKRAPLFERLERDLAMLRQTQDTMSRARHLLETYSVPPPLLAPPLADETAVFTAPRPNQHRTHSK